MQLGSVKAQMYALSDTRRNQQPGPQWSQSVDRRENSLCSSSKAKMTAEAESSHLRFHYRDSSESSI